MKRIQNIRIPVLSGLGRCRRGGLCKGLNGFVIFFMGNPYLLNAILLTLHIIMLILLRTKSNEERVKSLSLTERFQFHGTVSLLSSSLSAGRDIIISCDR